MQNSIPAPGRDHQFDNIRLILIFFVIFGHLIEYFAAGGVLYRWIYSFHMLVFIFVSGYFAKFDPKKIVCNILVPYVLLQILYTAFDRLLYGNAPFRLQFTTPYWLLWYLLSLFCYYLLLPLIDTDRAAVQLFVFLACVALALLSGFGQGFGYFLSLSRTFVFLPFFVGGFYLKKHGTWLTAIRRGGWPLSALAFAVPLAALFVFAADGTIAKEMLYGSYSYSGEYTAAVRALLGATGFLWVFFFLRVVPQGKIPLLSVCGANTLPIFLLHGFFVRLAGAYGLFAYHDWNYLLAFGCSVCMIAAFGNRPAGKLFTFVFTAKWADKIYAYCKGRRRETSLP